MTLWNSTYETGNATVDNDHKEIFALVEQVLQTSFKSRKEKIKTAIDFLANYTVRHFGNEERLMDESAFPHAEMHKKQHADFLTVVTKLVEKFEGNGYALGATEDVSDSTVLHLSLEINKVVVGWLTNHIMSSDRALADHYRLWADKKSVKR